MRRFLIAALLVLAAAAASYAATAGAGAGVAPGGAASAPRPRIEVTFVLDSTGSMGGLIEGEDLVHREQHHRAKADARREDRAGHLPRPG